MILLRLFKNSRSAGVAGMIILSLAMFAKSFIQPAEIVAYSAMPFYNLVFGAIHTTPVLNRIVTLFLLWIICYMLIRISVRYVLLGFRSIMPAFFFLFFTVALPGTQQVSPALVGSIFYLLCFAILFDVHDKRPDTFSVFNAAIVLTVGSMFYLKLIWFLPLIWISLPAMRTVTWRELFYPVIAYFLLGLFLFSWYWIVLEDSTGFTTLIIENLSFEGSLESYHFSAYIYYGFLLLMVLIASIYMVNRFQTRKIVIRNIYQVMFFMFIAGILFFLFIARFDTTSLVYMAFPVSFILSNYFHRKKNHWMHELIMWIVIGLVVYVQWMI
ncbi:MAG: hypothetical protein KAR19_07685 [Bacteroidales bacterium]|nr:hypothetical protein [Bacteroidales bacterium]